VSGIGIMGWLVTCELDGMAPGSVLIKVKQASFSGLHYVLVQACCICYGEGTIQYMDPVLHCLCLSSEPQKFTLAALSSRDVLVIKKFSGAELHTVLLFWLDSLLSCRRSKITILLNISSKYIHSRKNIYATERYEQILILTI